LPAALPFAISDECKKSGRFILACPVLNTRQNIFQWVLCRREGWFVLGCPGERFHLLNGMPGCTCGGGTDVVQGSIGNDRIYSNNMGEMDVLIAEGETAEGVDEHGNLLSGRNGNDFVYGSNRNDALFGGIVKSFLFA